MSLPVAPPDVASARRLGERACVVDAGGQFTAARQVDDLAAHAAVGGAREFVFDLGGVRRYETEALVELSALCRRLTSYGCEVIVAAHDPGVVLELRRLAHGDGWQIAPTLSVGARRPASRGRSSSRARGSEPVLLLRAAQLRVAHARVVREAARVAEAPCQAARDAHDRGGAEAALDGRLPLRLTRRLVRLGAPAGARCLPARPT